MPAILEKNAVSRSGKSAKNLLHAVDLKKRQTRVLNEPTMAEVAAAFDTAEQRGTVEMMQPVEWLNFLTDSIERADKIGTPLHHKRSAGYAL